jgi:glucose-6-phosphate-specific signal transduction histidine kinase
MEQAFTQIHNGPLQTLALLLRDVQLETTPSPQLFQRLNDLNAEIRAVGRSLTDEAHPEQQSAEALAALETATFEQTLRLGEGTCIDLNRPLHNLLHEVYALTLKRNLPYFQTVRVKVRNFAPLEQSTLTLEMKRDLCLWLEEALCNVGKHARGTTRIVVTGQHHEGQYVLKVQDNGAGLKPGQGQGTKHCNLLAQRLAGQFRRESLPKGGVICELSWLVES